MIHPATPADLPAVTNLALSLWPSHTFDDLEQEMGSILADPKAMIALYIESGKPIGFAQCQLRFDYVQGTDSRPVGYLEGIYIDASHRRQGIAHKLLSFCENWAKEQGCTEFASDCELYNTDSLRFHLGVGFEEAGRIICFKKQLS